ncbi:MAG: Fe-S cluster assembly protein IscX [Oligoflexia bacterium]|nr:Fe-S cluster assembly protein IscX [Oligoflexia bacterium]
MGLRWTDFEDIGIVLKNKYPELKPLNVSTIDIHRFVIELPDFEDDPKKTSPGILESIQMAWAEEYRS